MRDCHFSINAGTVCLRFSRYQASRIACFLSRLVPGRTDRIILLPVLLILLVASVILGVGIGAVPISAERNTLHLAFAEAAKHDPLVIAEKGVMGGEYTVGIVGSGDDLIALPTIKIEPGSEFYDYEAKYNRDDTRYLCPCGLPEAREAEIRKGALEAFRVIGGRGWGRVDFLLDEDGNHYFLEVNTSPGMTDHSLVPMAARAAGMDYPTLLLYVLRLGQRSYFLIIFSKPFQPYLLLLQRFVYAQRRLQ